MERINRPEKDHQADETEKIEAAMMYWETPEGSLVKEPDKETDDQEERANKEMQKQKDEEEDDDSTLHTGNQLRILIKEFSWGMDDNASMRDAQETAQWQLVYITKS